MSKLIASLVLLTVLISCRTTHDQNIEYLPLSNFDNDTSRIQSDTRVRLLAFSGSKDNDKETIYYSQIIVVNLQTGDTLSILCPALKYPAAEGVADNVIITPNDFDPAKGTNEANYQRSDASANMILQIVTDVMETENTSETDRFDKYLDGSIIKNQLVAVNRSRQ